MPRLNASHRTGRGWEEKDLLVTNQQVLSSSSLTLLPPQVTVPGAESGPRLPAVLELEVGSGLVHLPGGRHARPAQLRAGSPRLSPSPQLVQRIQTLSQLLLSLQVQGLRPGPFPAGG